MSPGDKVNKNLTKCMKQTGERPVAKCMRTMGYNAAIPAITTKNYKDSGGVCVFVGVDLEF